MPSPRQLRIAIFLQALGSDSGAPRISRLSDEMIAHLRARDVEVDLIVPENQPFDIGDVRPAHDLYVLKEKTPLIVSLAGALTMAGAAVVNTFQSCNLTRDKITTTAVLAASGVPVPPSWTTSRPALLDPLLADGPIWLKPQRGSRGSGVFRLTDPGALDGREAPTDAHGLPLPLFAQREVPSDGRDLKVFVVGEHVWAIARQFPARTLQEKVGAPLALRPDIRAAALTCGRALGLELYGVDFLVSGDRFFAVDVNAFPGYKGVPEAPCALADYLYRRALRARNRCPE
jgi:ribosomal protein S6--L-glutamate ligase